MSEEIKYIWNFGALGDWIPCSTIEDALEEARTALEQGADVITIEKKQVKPKP